MAQYGKSYYGASYYGASGAFTGQFQSDRTALLAPVDDLVFEIIAKLNRTLYTLPASIPPDGMTRDEDTQDQYSEYWASIYRAEGAWSGGETSDTAAVITASFTGSDMVVHFGTPSGVPAIASVTLRRYELGELVETLGPYTLDTGLGTELPIPDMAFGEYEADISIDAGSQVDSVLLFSGIEMGTNHISLELSTENSSTWSEWARVPLAYEEVEPGVFSLTSGTITELIDESATINAAGATGYEFRLFMASSESDNSPEIVKLDIGTSDIHTRAEVGIWKMAIDMGFGASVGVDDVLSVEYDADIPQGTKLSIQTRSTDDTDMENPLIEEDEISWSDWSVPYSKSLYRMIMDTKANPSLNSAVIYTPVITPENLKTWTRMIPQMFINYHDPLSVDLDKEVVNNHSSIRIEVLDGNLDIIKTADEWGATNESRYVFKKPLDGEAIELGQIDKPIRLRIFLLRDTPYSTPAIEDINLFAQSEYTEVKSFGDTGFESYASAVFGDNTGEDIVYLDGKTRDMEASVANMGFVLPGIESPDGVVTMDYAEYTIGKDTDLVSLFWDDTGNKKTTLETGKIVARVTPDGKTIKRHVQYGSGITLSIDGEDFPDSQNTTSIFSPPLNPDGEYAYHIRNGYTYPSTINTNVDIRWKSENSLGPVDRRNISYIQAEEVYSSIKSAITGNITDWKSEEIMMEGYVNLGSPNSPIAYEEKISSRLPEIPPDAIITSDSPYVVEIIPNTVTSEGEVRDESRISIEIDESYKKYIEVTEEKVLLVRGPSNTNQDFLPKSNTISVHGVYKNIQDYAPTFWEGTHFTVVGGNTIDWSPMINDPEYSGPTPPVEGDELYISYTYSKLSEIRVEGESSYNRNDYSSVSIYRSKNAIQMEGLCSYGSDYVSDILDLEEMFSIPDGVDKRTLMPKVVITNNPYVDWSVKNKRVVISLGDVNPKENWHPSIRDGFYYLGKNSYYLFTSPNEIMLDSGLAPRAENVSYVRNSDGFAIAVQEGTTNMIENPDFLGSGPSSIIFKDGFER